MKKFISVLLIIGIFMFIPCVKAKENNDNKVSIYLFWASYCPHCHDFIKYMVDNKSKYDDFAEVKTYMVDGNEENGILFDEISKNFENYKGGVPLIVVGDFHQVGFGKDALEVINAAKKAYDTGNKIDLLLDAVKNSGVLGVSHSIEVAANAIGYEKVTETEEENNENNFNQNNTSSSVIDEKKEKKIKFSLSTKEVAYIVIGSILGSILLALGIVFIVKKQKSKK